MADLTPIIPSSSPTATTEVIPDTPAPTPRTPPPFNEISVLFPLLTLYTVAYLALMLADFLLKDAFELPEGMLPLYIALLGAYAADKEVRRWLVNPEPPRWGSLFVYCWLAFYLAAYLIHSFRPDYVLPNNLLSVCLQVLGIFFGSKTSKYIHGTRQGVASLDPSRERLVLELITARSRVTRQMLVDELGISRSVAGRLLESLEAKRLVVRQGEGKGTYYVAAAPSLPA